MTAAAAYREYPKVLLHDHLDGGLRPSTVVELANEYSYTRLPTTDPDQLATWFHRGAKRNDLVLYLETFAHTVGVMQHRDAIERQLAHAERDAVRAAYNFAEHLPERKRMMQSWADYLDTLRVGAAVIPLTRTA